MWALAGLFLAAFLAATLLPAQSEALLVALLVGGGHSAVILVAVASLGNVLGSIVNWVLGRFADRFSDRAWFPVSPARMAQAKAWYQRWGYWSLLGSWLPVVGDPITLVAGVMGTPFGRFVLLVGLAKVARYAILAWLTLAWI